MSAKQDNLYQVAAIDDVQKEYIKKIYANKNNIKFKTRCEGSYVSCEEIEQCISVYWICDGEYDCFDLSDESNETHHCDQLTTAEPSSCIGHGYVPCQNNPLKCARFCDGTLDCDDSSDEKDCIEDQGQTVITASDNIVQTIESHKEIKQTDYALNFKKTYVINSPRPYVQITFAAFELEPPEDDHCFDFLEITDGDDNKLVLCGTETPSTTKFKVPIKLLFVSDYKMVGFGFLAHVKNFPSSANRRKRSNEDHNEDIVAAYDRIAKISGSDWKSVYYIMRRLRPTDFSFANKFTLFHPAIPYSYGVSIENLVLTCAFGATNCATITRSGNSHFHLMLSSEYGKCYTFNSKKAEEQRKSLRSGVDNGLALVIFLKDYENIGFLSKTSGISLTITPPNIYPLPKQNNIFVKPGSLTKITLKKKRINRLMYPYSTCTTTQPNWKENKQVHDSLAAGIFSKNHSKNLDSGEASFEDPFLIWETYNQQVCFEACLYENLKLECGCVDSYLYLYHDSKGTPETPFPICSPWNTSQILCKEKLYNKFRSVSSLIYPCDCPQSCSDTMYDVKQYSVDFPSRSFLYYFINEIVTSTSEEAKKYIDNLLGKLSQGDITEDEFLEKIRENFLRVEIFFEEMNYEVVSESPSYTFEELLSAFAGNIGMFVGWSVLTFSQMILFLVNVIHAILEKVLLEK